MRTSRIAAAAAVTLLTTLAAPLAAHGARPALPKTLPVAWHAAGAHGAVINQPALWRQRVVYTGDNTATARNVVNGHVVWTVTHPDDNGFHLDVGEPTLFNGRIDASIGSAGIGGSVSYNPASGAYTLAPLEIHYLRGTLAVDRSQSALISGTYGSGYGPLYLLSFAGRTWFVGFGTGFTVGTPRISEGRAFVVVGSEINAFDPAQPCVLLPIPDPPPYCMATWHAATPGAPQRPSPAGPGRIATADSSGVVTAFNAATGAVAWTSPNLHAALAPTAFAGGRVYASGVDGVLRVLDAATGARRWRSTPLGPLSQPATVDRGRVYVASSGGGLASFAVTGCGRFTCAPIAVGNAHLGGAAPAGAPLVCNGTAIVAYGNQIVAFKI